MNRCSKCQLGQGRGCRCQRPMPARSAAWLLLALNACMWLAVIVVAWLAWGSL